MKRGCFFIAAFSAALLLAGCVSSGKHWWSPATWFSSREAVKADAASAAVGERSREAVKAAHVEVAKTGEALAHAPESREVELARRFNDNADALLTQGNGALTLEEKLRLQKLVADLRSENAQVRAAAEATQGAAEKALAAISAELATAQGRLATAQADLRTAFDRENKLADELRNERVVRWALASVAVAAAAGWLYLRVAAGGLPAALGRVLRDADQEDKSGDFSKRVRQLLDTNLDRNEQRAVKAHYQP